MSSCNVDIPGGTMSYAVELRYYEILFTKLISQFHSHYKMDKLSAFIEMASFISEANTLQLQLAMQRVLTNDPLLKINRDEYIICLKLYTDLKDVQIRQLAKCSPNTIMNAMRTYEDGNIHIQNRFDLAQSNEIKKVMKGLRSVGSIY